MFCEKDAGTVIKTYSPELIVHPVLGKNLIIHPVHEPIVHPVHDLVVHFVLGNDLIGIPCTLY